MTLLVVIALAGATGAVARALVDGLVADRTRGIVPLGTMAVNVTGSFAAGLVTGLFVFHGLGHDVVPVAVTGFCGGFTTWSTFTWEAVRLAEDRQGSAVAVHVTAGLLLSLGAAAAGFALAAL